jgi:arylsulfatase A-like enzyme
VIVDHTIDFLERHQDEPFLVNVWLNDTHATLDPDEKQLEPYRHLMPVGLEGKHAGANAIYYAVVTEADRQIGRLLHRLDELGLEENTIVIFSADNGPEDIGIRNASHSGVGSPGPFRGRKRSLYEGGIRVPFLMSWPRARGPVQGAPSGVVDDDTPLCAVDLLPTFCALAGIDVPEDVALDGEDMTDVFCGAKRARSTPLLWEWRFHVYGHCINRSPMLAIRQGDWKLLLNPSRDRVELYDIPNDPMELNNRAGDHPALVAQMSERVLAWQTTLPEGPLDPTAGSNAYPWPGRQQRD